MNCAKTAEPIEMPFGTWTRVGSRNPVLDGGPDPHTRRGNFEGEKGRPVSCPGMFRGRYIQSDSRDVSTGMVPMPTGAY